MDRLLGRAARWHGRRLRARGQLPGDARRLDRAARLGDLRRWVGEARRGDGGTSRSPRRPGARRHDRPPDRGLGRPRPSGRPRYGRADVRRGSHARLEPRPEAHVPRARRRRRPARGVSPVCRALALRRDVDVLLLPGARDAGALARGRVRSARRGVLRSLDVRDARPARRQRLRLPARGTAPQPRPLLRPSVALRVEPRTGRQGGVLRASRSLRTTCATEATRPGRSCGSPTPRWFSSGGAPMRPGSKRRTSSAGTSRARSTSSA